MDSWKKVTERTVNIGPEKFLVSVEPINEVCGVTESAMIARRIQMADAQVVTQQIALVPELVTIVGMFLQVVAGTNDFPAAAAITAARKVLRHFPVAAPVATEPTPVEALEQIAAISHNRAFALADAQAIAQRALKAVRS